MVIAFVYWQYTSRYPRQLMSIQYRVTAITLTVSYIFFQTKV